MAEGPNESRPELIGENPFGPPAPPPLRIAHLMLWTAGSAVILAMYRGIFDEIEPSVPHAIRLILTVSLLLGSMICGAAISSVAVFLYRRFTKGPPFPVQPGHWLLLILGVVELVTLPAWRLLRCCRRIGLRVRAALGLYSESSISGFMCWTMFSVSVRMVGLFRGCEPNGIGVWSFGSSWRSAFWFSPSEQRTSSGGGRYSGSETSND